jgi:hypothetical protein
VYYRSDTGVWDYAWNHSGSGTEKDFNFSMAEGAWIQYYVCLGEYGNREVLWSTCGADAVDYA